MKRKLLSVFCVCLTALMLCMALFAGCFGGGGGNNNNGDDNNVDDTPKEYTIQYTTDSGNIKLTVTQGETYSLDIIPEKTGYDFLGLFDSETGGTQYVGANGSSSGAFVAGKDLVLYPQYKTKEYTVILDYQGADVTGSRQITATYGQNLPELPKDLTLPHKEFTGWYTEAQCGGEQITDKFGLIPIVSIFNEENFNVFSTNNILYAGFETEKIAVTCYFDEGEEPETVQVDYDSPINYVLPSKRKDGNAVLNWAKERGGEVYSGKITEPIALYAIEYAPVIELDLNGGNGINAVVARAGTKVSVPTPTKNLAQFSHWEYKDGYTYKENDLVNFSMPSESLTLKAIWQAKIIFNKNGGTDVQDISEKAGTAITLPLPKKDGYVFAGWYNTDKEQYTSTIMPAVGIKLKAGWYKAKNATVTLIENDTNKKITTTDKTFTTSHRLKLDLSNILSTISNNGVNIIYKVNFKWANRYNESAKCTLALYEGTDLSTSNLLYGENFIHNGDTGNTYIKGSFGSISTIHNNILYLYYAADGGKRGVWPVLLDNEVNFFDIYIELSYPDTAKLYL